MASFAPGTPQAYVNNYYRTMPRWLGGQVPDNQHAYGVPNTAQPGRAQPQQSPWFTSTPYSPQQSQPFSAYGQKRGGFQAWSPNNIQAPSPPAPTPQTFNFPQPFGQAGNMANGGRPPAFQASYQNFDGTTSQQPNYQQRDAFIARINDVLGRLQQQSWQQPTGAPQFDFAKMWNQAGSMVEGGWQNPFARRQT